MGPAPIKDVVAGLPTKASKIRALAKAGYLRTEIASILKIRYQHVRNVLVQSGIESGKRRSSPTEPKPRKLHTAKPVPVSRFAQAGFERVGACRLIANDAFDFTAQAPPDPGVYAFVVNGMIAYIGLTRRSLRQRLGHYVYGHEKQKTSARVKRLIIGALRKGDEVEVFIARPPDLEWNGLPVDGPSGLETALIRTIRPRWNQQGVTS